MIREVFGFQDPDLIGQIRRIRTVASTPLRRFPDAGIPRLQQRVQEMEPAFIPEPPRTYPPSVRIETTEQYLIARQIAQAIQARFSGEEVVLEKNYINIRG